jgi:hypothetical protein
MRIRITAPQQRGSKSIQLTANAHRSTVEDMGIDHRRPHLAAPEQLLDRAAEENLFRAGERLEPARMEQEGTHPAGCSKSSSSKAAASCHVIKGWVE